MADDTTLKFLHTSDFELDRPLHGMIEIPDHLREILIEGAYRAAERVVDTAIAERVAFVCVAGDLLDLSAPSPRSLAFLRSQFQRLDNHDIPIYWAGKDHDPREAWPSVVPLPETVHCFDPGRVESLSHDTGNSWKVRISGRSGRGQIAAAEVASSRGHQYSVGIFSGTSDSAILSQRPVDYWALGGQSSRKTLFSKPSVAHYAGTPQGRTPRNLGPHGCTLVEVVPPRETRLRFVPCDVARWQHERVIVSAAAGWPDFQEILEQRVNELRSQNPAVPLLTRWTLSAVDTSVESSALRQLAKRSLAWLRKQFGHQSEACWPVSVEVDTHQHIAGSAYEEDTLLGDYLRAVRTLQENAGLSALDSSSALGQQLEDDLGWLADLSDSNVRDEVLDEAAGLGAALLRGDKPI